MALIQTLNRASGEVLQTYKAKRGNITHVLTSEIPGVVTTKYIVNCDSFGNPKKVVDMVPGKRMDIYVKAEDGTTLQKKGKDFVRLAHVTFNNLCERIFQQK